MKQMSTGSTAAVVPTTSRKAASAAYLGLMKPHVTVMLLGVTLASMVLATGGLPPLRLILATLAGGALAAGSANALNCYWDRDIDRLMQRTRRRSVPAGRVAAANALRFGLALGVGSFLILGIFVNLLSALLALAAILFYVCVYTMWLKRATPRNIVIGGAAGAVPVLVGWAAVTNALGLTPLVLFLIIFLWTPPHFWALALVLRQDYARAGVPMLPVARGEHETYRQIVRYTVILVATSLVPVVTHALGLLYLVCALALGAGLLVYALRLAIARRPGQAYALFWLSNHYLALLFAAMVVDRLLH